MTVVMTDAISTMVKLATAGAALLLVASSAGCATDRSAPDIATPPVFRESAAAPVGVTLNAWHFDGPDLNEAGMALLDSTVHGTAARPLVVYLGVPTDGDATAEGRRAAVGSFLRGEGLVGEQFELRGAAGETTRAD